MTRLGKMLYDDGEKCGQANVLTLIQKMTVDGALETVPRLTTDPEFYKAMVQKYGIEA